MFMKILRSLCFFVLSAFLLSQVRAQDKSPTTKTATPVPTPAEIDAAVGMLQNQVQTQTPPPLELRRDEVPKNKDVPQDFREHTPVTLPGTAQQALLAGMPWGNQVNLPARGKDGRILYTFGEALPILVCSPLRICVVELEAGEQFTGVPHIGDSIRWDLSIETSGAGDTAHPIIVLKPKDKDLDTSLFVTTTRRSYYIRLLSTSEVYTPIIAFSYPEEQRAEVARQIEQQQEHRKFIDATQISVLPTPVENMFFDYTMKGDHSLRPVRVMDDGAKTYIQMPPDVIHRELPTLAIEGPGGKELVNFRVKGNIYIVDRLFNRAVLLLGAGKHTQKVEIIRNSKGHDNDAHSAQVATGGF
jgi:type IV secretion system protein VirB9